MPSPDRPAQPGVRAGRKEKTIRKSITLRMFPQQMATLRRLDLAREAGFDGVEVNLEPWQEYSLATSHEDLVRLRSEVEARGLRVSAVYDREQWHFPMSSEDPAKRARCRDIILGLARAATVLGTDTVLVMPGAVDNSILAPEPEIVGYRTAYRNSQEILGELARIAGDEQRVYLAIENCPAKFLLSPLEFARFVDEIDNPWLVAYFDVGNALEVGVPEDWIRILGPRIKRIHLKDIRMLAGGSRTLVPLLAGDVNWPAVREALREIEYDGWVTAEVFPHYTHLAERFIFDTSASMDAILALA